MILNTGPVGLGAGIQRSLGCRWTRCAMADATAAPTISANCFGEMDSVDSPLWSFRICDIRRETSNEKGFEDGALGSFTFHFSRLTFHGT